MNFTAGTVALTVYRGVTIFISQISKAVFLLFFLNVDLVFHWFCLVSLHLWVVTCMPLCCIFFYCWFCVCCLCPMCLFFMSAPPPSIASYLAYSLRCVVAEVVACLFASPPPPTPFPMLLRPWLLLQRSPPPLLQTCPRPPPPPLPPACLSHLRGTRSPGASPRPWRQSSPFTLPPLCPGPGSGGPAYLHWSPPL